MYQVGVVMLIVIIHFKNRTESHTQKKQFFNWQILFVYFEPCKDSVSEGIDRFSTCLLFYII